MQGYADTAAKVPALALGTYRLLSTATYTSQTWEVTADEVRIFTAQSGVYAPEFLGTMTHARALEILATIALLRFPTPEFTPAPVPPIGKPAARELHRELGRLGFTNHYLTASDALGYPVASLAALSADDAYTVRSYARGQWGLSA